MSRYKIHIILFFIFWLFVQLAVSQTLDYAHFEGRNIAYTNKYKDVVKQVNKLLKYEPIDYDAILVKCNFLQKGNSEYAELHFLMGKAYLKAYHSHNYAKALWHFKKAQKLGVSVNHPLDAYLGTAHHLNGNWDLAIQYLELAILKLDSKKQVEALAEFQKRLAECERGKQFSATKSHLKVENLGDKLNSKYPDYGAVLNSDETVLYFTSRRANTTGQNKDGLGYFEDIYESRKVNGEWGFAKNVRELNSRHHDAVISLSGNGKKMILYREGDLYESELQEDGKWAKPRKMSRNINSKFPETSASLSFNGDKLYFVSQKPKNNQGGLDVFVSDLGADGHWGEAQNIGKNINTPYDERGVFVLPDGRTMYFSSKGHDNMGGLDIFKSELVNGIWSKPINLGVPINTPDHDVFLAVSANEQNGYYSKISDAGFGGKDIYRITFLDAVPDALVASLDTLALPNREGIIKPEPNTNKEVFKVLRGSVVDNSNKCALEKILIQIWQENQLLIETTTNSKGEFLSVLKANIPYQVRVKSISHLPLKESIAFNSNSSELHQKTFMLTANSQRVLASSTTNNLFAFTPNLESHPDVVNAQPEWKLLKGKVLNSNGFLPIQATVEIYDRLSHELVSQTESDGRSGVFFMAFPKEIADYTVVVRAKGFMFHTEDIRLLSDIKYQNIVLKPLAKGELLTLYHIFFKKASDDLIGTSFYELDQVIRLMEENPELYIQIRGHTDNQGDYHTLMRLSNARADKILRYLANNGVAAHRLHARGFGGNHPIASNDTEEERSLNRRVEFRVIKIN